MPSALIWSIESVILGLWALALAQFSTPLHVFVARCHVLISAFTALLHLVIVSRNLVVGSAVSQAFLSAVSGLFLVYLSAVLGDDKSRHFKLPSVGLLTLDAVIGLAWFSIAMLSSLGMALSFVKLRDDTKTEKAQSTFLMFHTHGVHLVVILPCLALSVSVQWLLVLCTAVWLAHIIYMISGMDVMVSKVEFQSMGWVRVPMLASLYAFSALFQFATVTVSLTVIFFVDMGFKQQVLVVCLLWISGVPSMGALLYSLVVKWFPNLPALDWYFSADREEENRNIVSPRELPVPSGSVGSMWLPRQPPLSLFLPRHADPAAVSMKRPKMG